MKSLVPRYGSRTLFACVLLFFGLVFALSQTHLPVTGAVSFMGTPTDTPTPCSTPGSLDTTFDGDGKVITRFGDGSILYAIALQADGKIVAVGSVDTGTSNQFLVVRYNVDGSLDETFAGQGYTVTEFGGSSSRANAVAIQSDGKIVAVGTVLFNTSDFAIARYNPDGSLDDSFDDDGTVTTSVPGPHGDRTDVANAVVVQNDGKLIVAGQIPDGSGTASDFGVLRYNTNGSVDLTFGFRGKTTASINDVDHAHSVAIQTDGRIVVAGQSGSYLGIARFNADGSPDISFDGNGTLSTSFGFSTNSLAITLQSDDKIVAAGVHNGKFALARFRNDGSYDTSFGTNGISQAPIGRSTVVAMQPDGKLVAAGDNDSPQLSQFVTVRYNSDGTLDNSFDDDGIVVNSLGNGSGQVQARSLAIQSDAKILIAGHVSGGSANGFGLVRYNGAPCGAPTATPTETPTYTPSITPTASPTPTSTLTNTPTATPTATPNSSCTFDNGGSGGGLNPQAFTESGVAAPEGFFWSEVQHDAGNLDEANNVGGWNARQGAFRLADNFTIAQPCRIETIDLYGYQINATGPLSPFTATTLRIWKGRPGDLGSQIVFGDTTTNRLAASVDSTYYRIFNTVAPPPGTNAVTTNKIWKNTLAVGTALTAGTYWIDWASTVSNGGNHFYPGKTIAGSRGDVLDDARQLSGSPPGQWSNVVDSGFPFSALDYRQDFPFNVTGEVPSPTPTATATATVTPTATPVTPVTECDLSEEFDDITTLSAIGWPEINRSSPAGSGTWFQGNDEVFPSQSGADNSYIAVNFQSGGGNSTLSNWLLTPPLLLQNGGRLIFWTRTVDQPNFPDRLQVRMSTNGDSENVGAASTDLGDFTTLLLDINPAYEVNAYPNAWTQYSATISGLASPVKGRLAFRYFVEDGGPSGNNSDYIGIDSVIYACSPTAPITPTSTPTETPTTTSTNTPTHTSTGTPTPSVPPAIEGVVTYGNAAVPPQFVSGVTISGEGSIFVEATTSFSNGAYYLIGFGEGAYTMTASKPSESTTAISSFDAALVARHVSGSTPLSGSQLAVADVSNNGDISSFDASQIVRYVISLPPHGTTGTWKFLPASRDYPFITSSVAGEDYSALLMGEVSGNWTNNGTRSSNGPERSIFVNMPRITTSAEGEILVPIFAHGIAHHGVISYEFDLRYDPEVIQPQTVPFDLTGTVSNGLTAAANVAKPGMLRVAVYGPMPIESNGVLLNLRFTAVGNSGSVTPLSWDRFVFNEGDPAALFADGFVELSATATTYR